MKALLVAENRNGALESSVYELLAFAEKAGAEPVLFLVGSEDQLPQTDARLYLAEAAQYGDFNPDVHKQLLLSVIEQEQPDTVAFVHSSYGWDLAPRVALALQAAQVSEVVDLVDGGYAVPVCNAKLRRNLKPTTAVSVVTLQAGAFTPAGEPSGAPEVKKVALDQADGRVEFQGYETAEAAGVDLGKAEVIVSAGRGVGKKDNIETIAQLARALGGELGASRPVVDAGWLSHDRQVGTTGQSVAPKLYVACGISGAIQHLAGMKKSDFLVAINKDKDAPIGEAADVLVVADVMQFAPALIERLQ